MNIFGQRTGEARRGFSLVEVIIAIGLVAGSIVAIIAFLGSIGQATSEVMSSSVASRIAANVRAELENEDMDLLASLTNPTNTQLLTLYATKDGERVRLEGPSADAPESATPPGIPQFKRFFKIEIRQLENSLSFDSTEFGTNPSSSMLPLAVHVIWPYQLPLGPEIPSGPAPDYTTVGTERQSRYLFNTTLLRKR